MANFFFPSDLTSASHRNQAADAAALSEMVVQPGHLARVGLWGGNLLTVKVTRGGLVVNEGAHPKVKFERAVNDKANHIQIWRVTGLAGGDSLQAWDAEGRPQTAPLPVRALKGKPADVIDLWAQHFTPGGPVPDDRACCSFATPYLALKDPKPKRGAAMTRLLDARIGGPLVNAHGLAVHCTAASSLGDAFGMAAWHCVETWNDHKASAHFGIAADGTLVQFISANFIANAQHDPGNFHWHSVEIDNNGSSEMTGPQFDTLKKLFRWVGSTFGVSPTLATGCLYPKAPQFDGTTKAVCAEAGVATTTDNYEAVMSTGVSCHWWLDPVKVGKHVHACPGKGIIGQLAKLVK
jgi:hypothetical protein